MIVNFLPVLNCAEVEYEYLLAYLNSFHFYYGLMYMYMYRDAGQFCIHSKNSRVSFDPEKSPRGPDPFWGQTYPESRLD